MTLRFGEGVALLSLSPFLCAYVSSGLLYNIKIKKKIGERKNEFTDWLTPAWRWWFSEQQQQPASQRKMQKIINSQLEIVFNIKCVVDISR